MRRWVVPAAFLVAAGLTASQTVREMMSALGRPDGRHLLIVLYLLLRTGVAAAFVVFTIGRSEPQERSREPIAFVACAVAMVAVLALTPPRDETSLTLVLAGDLIAVASCTWLLISVLALGRCFGVLPEARGLVTRGPFAIVRHPLYLGELGACFGLALAAPGLRNGLVLVVLASAQLTRMGFEERALAAAFPGYSSYAAATPRLIPRVAAPRVRGSRQRTARVRTAEAEVA